MKYLFYPLSAVLLFASCDAANKTTTTSVSSTTGHLESIDLNYMNKEIRPQDDFFQYSNGTWVAENPVPSTESSWGSFNELDQANKKKLTGILEEFAAMENKTKGEIQQILGDYYASFIDMDRRNKAGMDGIRDEIQGVREIGNERGLATKIGEMHGNGIGALFSFGVTQDLKKVDSHIAGLWQGGLGLPNKDYYLEENKKEVLQKYENHIASMFQLTGIAEEESKTMANRVVAFEKALAEKMMSRAELRVPEKTYNKMSRRDAVQMAGNFDLERYLQLTAIGAFDSLIVGQPDYLAHISEMVKKEELSTWKFYLEWKIINHYAGHLDERFVAKNFEFYGGVLSGRTEMKPINERAISEITGQEFGELLGKAFVGRYYSDVAKQRVNTMVDNLLIVFRQRIEDLEWMDKPTKKQALAKLEAIGRKLGYPDKWEDFSSLDFRADDYLHNVREAARYSERKNMAELNQPVDKDEWGMPAHMVNAYYHPLLNEIAFPAGIMQEPFFSEQYEDAVNYGRIGMVIGHEFTHGFDDMGSKFAADGSFSNWWTEEDRTAFEDRTAKLGKTFEAFCPVEGNCVNPQLTMGENIADLGGLTLAYYAYKMTDEFKSGAQREGYTPAQRFFIAYAQLWKINYTEEELKNRLSNDSHSPGMFRVNGPLMNCPEFFEAFDVKEGSTMRNPPEKIAKIW